MASGEQLEELTELVSSLSKALGATISRRQAESKAKALTTGSSVLAPDGGVPPEALEALKGAVGDPKALQASYRALVGKGVQGLDSLFASLVTLSALPNVRHVRDMLPQKQPLRPLSALPTGPKVPPSTPSTIPDTLRAKHTPATARARPTPAPSRGLPATVEHEEPAEELTPPVGRSLSAILAKQQDEKEEEKPPRPLSSEPGNAVASTTPATSAYVSNNPVYDKPLDPNSPVAKSPALPLAAFLAQPSSFRRSPAQPEAHVAGAGDLFLAPKPGPEGGPGEPGLAQWNFTRPFLNGTDILASADRQTGRREGDLAQFSQKTQELRVMDDLLYAMLGMDGSFVHAHKVEGGDRRPLVAFSVVASLEPSLQELAERMLPICEYVAIIQRFVETRANYEHGMVCQATAAAMRSVLMDWRLHVAQMEHLLKIGYLSMQAMWFYCQQPQAYLRVLASIAAEAASHSLRGAELLNLLQDKASSLAGSSDLQAHLQGLVAAAAHPYMRILELWLCQGKLEDPYEEFMVRGDKGIDKDSAEEDAAAIYWSGRFSLREPVPAFLESVKEDIMTTGKYLTAIRECHRPVERPLPAGESLEYDPQASFLPHIKTCFEAAASALLSLAGELGLSSVLRSLKHYFLLDQGDLMVSFFDIAEGELRKPASELSINRLQSLLEMGVRTSTAANDPNAESLGCTLDYRSLQGMMKDVLALKRQRKQGGSGSPLPSTPVARLPPQASPLGKPATPASIRPTGSSKLDNITGTQAFTLTFKVDWPISLVVSSYSLVHYQTIFRHLFDFKFVERQLTDAWRTLQVIRYIGSLGQHLRPAHWLCQQMTHFVQTYCTHTTIEVLEPEWHKMESSIRQATTIDEVALFHQRFLDQAVKGCLLIDHRLLKQMAMLKSLCLKFIHEVRKLDIEVTDADVAEVSGEDSLPRGNALHQLRRQLMVGKVRVVLEDSTWEGGIRQQQAEFTRCFHDLLLALRDKGKEPNWKHLGNLVDRMDYNHFFLEEYTR